MTELNPPEAADSASGLPHRAGGIARAAAAIGAGTAMTWAHHDLALGVNTAALAMNILREVVVRPVR